MNNLTTEYIQLMKRAEQETSRKEARHIINRATAVRELMGASCRYDLADYSGLR